MGYSVGFTRKIDSSRTLRCHMYLAVTSCTIFNLTHISMKSKSIYVTLVIMA